LEMHAHFCSGATALLFTGVSVFILSGLVWVAALTDLVGSDGNIW